MTRKRHSILYYLTNEKGEVGEGNEQETTVEAPDTGSSEELGAADESQSEAIQAQQAQPEETFLTGTPNLDPNKLPPDLLPIFKRMQGAYTKKMQDVARIRQQAEIVDRFNSDRDFAFNTLAQWATQNGYSIAPVGGQPQQAAPQQQQQQADKAPQQLVEQIKATLPPELQWMAESQAQAQWAAMKMMLQPVVQQAQQQQQQQQYAQRRQRETEYDQLAQELTELAPGWEEHEDAMSELLDFLQGPQMKHPKFGSKHQLLYNLVTGNAAAQAQVTKRMNQAAKNRPSSGITTGRTASNVADRIKAAKSSQDAFKLAAQAAGFTGE